MDQVDSDAAAETIRVGLVDDQAMVRAGFGMLIGSQDDMTVAWQASDGDEVPGKPPADIVLMDCLLYTSPSPRDVEESRMPSSA